MVRFCLSDLLSLAVLRASAPPWYVLLFPITRDVGRCRRSMSGFSDVPIPRCPDSPIIAPPLPMHPTAPHVIPDWRAFEKDRMSHPVHVADHAHVAPPRGPRRARCWLAGVEAPSAVFPCPDVPMPPSSQISSHMPLSLPGYPFCTYPA